MKGRIGDKQRLAHMLLALDEATGFIQGFTFEAFSTDARTLNACVRSIEVLGEAARHLTDATKLAHPAVPWQKMVSLRNFVIHQYFDVDNNVLWEVLTIFLPAVRFELEAALNAQS